MKHQTPNETYSGCLTEKIKKKLAHKAAIAMGKKVNGGFINSEQAISWANVGSLFTLSTSYQRGEERKKERRPVKV